MKKKVFVTGAGGFVGANLVRLLLKDKYVVHAIVRKDTNLWRLKDVEKKIVIHDFGLDNIEKMKRLFKYVKPYGVFHLATYGSYPFQQDERIMVKVNIVGTLNLLESLEGTKCKQIVISGSSSEYGKKDKAMRESDLLIPNNYYAATKAAQTHISQVYSKMNKKPLVILRLFNVYGPYEEKGRLVRSVIESGLQGRPIKLASGKEARDFVYAGDVADAFAHAIIKNKFYGEIFNIGTGVQTTISELAKSAAGIVGNRTPIRLNAYEGREWDTFNWIADIKKTEKILGWRAKTKLNEGLMKTIDWYKKANIDL